MRLGKPVKTPSEAKRYAIEYSDWLDTGEFLQSVTFDIPTPPGAPLTIIPEAIGSSQTQLAFLVSGGAHGNSYEVGVLTATTGGQVKESTLLFVVRDL